MLARARAGPAWLETRRGAQLGAVAIVILALAVRLAYIAYLARGGIGDIDSAMWETIGRQLAAGRGYVVYPGFPPTALRPPLYPLFIGAVYRLSGVHPLVLLAVQAFFTVPATLAIMGLARHVGGTSRGALLAGLLWALCPLDVGSLPSARSEPLLMAVFAAALWAFCAALHARRAGLAVAAGVLLGLSALTRDTAIALAPLAVLGLGRAGGWRRGLALALAFLVVWLPWPVRNAVEMHAFVPTSTMGGYVLWANHFYLAEPDYLIVRHPPAFAAEDVMGSPTSEVAWDRRLRDEGLRRISQYPGRYAVLVADRWLRLWLDLDWTRSWRRNLVFGAYQLAVWTLAVLGWRRARRPDRWMLLAVVLVFTAAYAAVGVLPRYFLPALPALLAVGAAAVGGAGRPDPRCPDASASRLRVIEREVASACHGCAL